MKQNKTKIGTLLILIFLLTILFPVQIPMANSSPDAVDDALTWAKAYLDRSYTEFNDTYAAMRDLPGLPFVMHDVTDDKWMCPAKATQAVQDGNDGPDWGYYGGCGIDVIDWGFDSFFFKLKYRWDTECDHTYDGVVMEVWLVTLDDVNMECTAIIQSKTDPDHCELWFNDEKVIDPVVVSSDFVRSQAYGWFTTRFIVRHGSKIAANMYNAIGETDKADKLLNMWYGSGYIKDAYDGVWGASNNYWDYSLIPPYKPWAADQFQVMPDVDIWGNIPWFQMDQEGTLHSGVPYRSQLHNPTVVTLGFNTGPLGTGKSWWESGFTFKMAWACHLLNKYGTSDLTKLAEAKQLIDDASWDGLGINCETVRIGSLLTSIYQYACYVPYGNAEYLAALTKYWQLTGDEVYGERADEVAGILLKVQVKPGDKVRVADSTGDIHLIWRPDHMGGFMCGYNYGGGFDFASNPWWMADVYFWCTSSLGLYNRDYAELSSCGWTNHETTLMCYAALYQYKQTGRTPLTSDVEFTFPFFDAQITTSHSDHGCYFSEVNYSQTRVRLGGTIYGESWMTVKYTWIVTLPSCTNFRTSLTFYSGELDALDGNAIERWVKIYQGNLNLGPCQLLVENYDKPIDGVGGIGQFYIMSNNMAKLPSVSEGIYTIQLIFRFSCGWAGRLWVGFRGDDFSQLEAFHVESFGYDCDVVPTPITPKYYVDIRSSGNGTVSPYGEYLFDEGAIVDSIATPFPYRYFWFWIINYTSSGYKQYCPNQYLYFEIYHDCIVTAYFSNVTYAQKGSSTCSLCPLGDIDMNGHTGLTDLVTVAKRYGKNWLDPDWLSSGSEAIDTLLHRNWAIGLSDLVIVAREHGRVV